MSDIIKVDSKEKSTTIRLNKTTKKALESLASGKETHEQIVLRLIKMANTLFADQGTQILNRKNAIGTRYEKSHKTISIETSKNKYKLVCTYNDLGIFNILRSKQLTKNYQDGQINISEWEVDLEIANIQKNNQGWVQLSKLTNNDKIESLLLYFVALKHILEESFDIKLYEFSTNDDFLNLDNWDKAYKRNSLSSSSYYSDVEKKLHGYT